MNKQTLTPWFVNGEKPVRKGVYNVSCLKANQTGMWFAFWTGKEFLAFDTDKGTAKQYGLEFLRKYDSSGAGTKILTHGSWRGLTTKAKASK